MNSQTSASSVATQFSPADRWISRAAAVTIAGLAGIAGALSYSHMRLLAQDHGQAGWHAHAFPLAVDGIEIVASLVLLADRRAERGSGWLPWTALAAGTAGSLAANVATAHPDPISRIIAGWPALALILAVKLLSGMLDRRNAAVPPVADPIRQAIDTATPATETSRTKNCRAVPAADSRPAKVRSTPADPKDQPPSPHVPTEPRIDSRIAALLPAARVARDALKQDGQTLTRDTLAACLREHGHPIRNASVTPLLRRLRDEQRLTSPPEPPQHHPATSPASHTSGAAAIEDGGPPTSLSRDSRGPQAHRRTGRPLVES